MQVDVPYGHELAAAARAAAAAAAEVFEAAGAARTREGFAAVTRIYIRLGLHEKVPLRTKRARVLLTRARARAYANRCVRASGCERARARQVRRRPPSPLPGPV